MTAAFLGALLILAGGSTRGHSAGFGEMFALTVAVIFGVALVYAWIAFPFALIGRLIGPDGNTDWYWLSLVWYGATLALVQRIGERRVA